MYLFSCELWHDTYGKIRAINVYTCSRSQNSSPEENGVHFMFEVVSGIVQIVLKA